MSTATGCASLLHMIDHAVHDDGDITFVKVNGEPRITFAWRHEDNFRDLVLTSQEKEFEARRIDRIPHFKYEVEILDIKPAEFGPLYDAYQAKRVKGYLLVVVHPDKEIIPADFLERSPVPVVDPHEPVILQK